MIWKIVKTVTSVIAKITNGCTDLAWTSHNKFASSDSWWQFILCWVASMVEQVRTIKVYAKVGEDRHLRRPHQNRKLSWAVIKPCITLQVTVVSQYIRLLFKSRAPSVDRRFSNGCSRKPYMYTYIYTLFNEVGYTFKNLIDLF